MRLISNMRLASTNKQKLAHLNAATTLEVKVLEYTYNPHKVYYIGKNHFPVNSDGYLGIPTIDMFTLLDFILTKEIKGQAAKDALAAHAEIHGSLILLIAMKDLRIGATATTINKVHHRLIPQHLIQKAKELPFSKIKYPVMSQLKYDGIRIIAIKQDGEVKLLTSGGKLTYFPNLIRTLEESDLPDTVLDGELIYKDGSKITRPVISGMNTTAMNSGYVDETHISFRVFDTLNPNMFQFQEVSIVNALDRYTQAKGYLREYLDNTNIRIAGNKLLTSKVEVVRDYYLLLSKGFEGVILKIPHSLYRYKRSADWIKLKQTDTADLICIGTTDGTGKYQGMIGALLLEGHHQGKFIRTNAASGMSDADRQMPPSYYEGEFIEVAYNSITEQKDDGSYSLFLPRYVSRRDDK